MAVVVGVAGIRVVGIRGMGVVDVVGIRVCSWALGSMAGVGSTKVARSNTQVGAS